MITTTTTITRTTTGAETTDIMIENDKEDDTTTLTAIIKQRIKQRMEQLKYTHSNLFTDQIMMFSDILFYTLCYRSIQKASKGIPFCFDMMKKEMAKHQERYTLLDELALGEEKEDEKKKERSLAYYY
jgi:hypothetical protein